MRVGKWDITEWHPIKTVVDKAEVTVHGPREGDRHISPGITWDNLLTERCSSGEFAGRMSQSPARQRLQAEKDACRAFPDPHREERFRGEGELGRRGGPIPPGPISVFHSVTW